MFIDKHIKIRSHRLSFCARALMHPIGTIGQIFGHSKPILICSQEIPFSFLRLIIASRAGQKHLKYCSGFRLFDNSRVSPRRIFHVHISVRFIQMLHNPDFARYGLLLDRLVDIVALQRKFARRSSHLVHGGIEQIPFRGRDLPNRPVCTAEIICSC